MRAALRIAMTPSRGPGFRVSGYGIVRTLPKLAAILNANPSANVTQLGHYNARRDGVFKFSGDGIISTTYTGTFDGQAFPFKNVKVISSGAGTNTGLFARLGTTGVVKNLPIGGYFAATAINLFGLNGTNPHSVITGITRANPGVITTSAAFLFNTGSAITLSGVVGMAEVNGNAYTVTKLTPTTFSIGVDTTGFTAYVSGGVTDAPSGVNTGTVASLVGRNDGLVQNCSSTATLVSSSPGTNNGGLVGFNSQTGVVDGGTCTTKVSLTSYGYSCYLSNVVGQNWGELKNVTVRGGSSFSPSGNMPAGVTNVGGSNTFAGPWQGCLTAANGGNSGQGTLTTALVHDCVVTGNPSVVGCTNTTNFSVGKTGVGIGINLEGKVYNNTVAGNVSGGADVGVLMGHQSEDDSLCYDNVAVGNATGVGARIGVICGHMQGKLYRCSGVGNATGLSNVAVGIGYNDDNFVRADADHLICVGTATATDVAGHVGVGIGFNSTNATYDQILCFGTATGLSSVGAVVGLDQHQGTNSYFCLESASPLGRGIGNITSPTGVHGYTSAQLLAGMPGGFDGSWARDTAFGGFPYLNTIAAPAAPVIPALNLIAFVGRSTSVGSTTIAMPPGIQAGDYAIIFDLSQNTATTGFTAVTPSGWTNAMTSSQSATTHGTRNGVYQRTLDGTETNVVGLAVGTRDKIMECLVFRATMGTVWAIGGSAHNQTNGAGSGVAAQPMGTPPTAPCVVIGRAVSDGGSFASPMISTGDDVDFALSGAVLISQSAYQIENFSALTANFIGDTTKGSAAASCFVSVS